MNKPGILVKTAFVVVLTGGLLVACSPAQNRDVSQEPLSIPAYGRWIKEPDGSVMVDPQPSGLMRWRDQLVTLSDRSAVEYQRLRLRPIDPGNATLVGGGMRMTLSEDMQSSCFAGYLSQNPDLEALVGDPDDDSLFYMVTEDATYDETMSAECHKHYQGSGSTEFPTLLVRLQKVSESSVHITHARPIQYAAEMNIGNSPNDGIEALAFGPKRTLYLGLEKDNERHARVFSLSLSDDFWQSQEFAPVSEPGLLLPRYTQGNHPINGMDYYRRPNGEEYLLASARNDSNLWVIDLSGKKPARIISLQFYAELTKSTDNCQDWELMVNASIEGVAVMGQTLWMVNDPWKEVYRKNIICEQNRQHYENYSPLLFSLPIESRWFD